MRAVGGFLSPSAWLTTGGRGRGELAWRFSGFGEPMLIVELEDEAVEGSQLLTVHEILFKKMLTSLKTLNEFFF